MADAVVIREPTPDDAAAVGAMHLASWREAYSALLPAAFWTGAAERFRTRWTANLLTPRPGVTTRIADRDGEVVGLATAGPARPNDSGGDPVRDRELWAMYVLAAHQGAGIADRLLDTVLPPGPAELWVFEANPRARAFYARHGFAADGARHVFGPDLGSQAEIRMVR